MSLFITHLAFYDPIMEDAAKLAILMASFLSGIIGFLLLYAGQYDPTEKYKEDHVTKNFEDESMGD